jgi:hypothetical protein
MTNTWWIFLLTFLLICPSVICDDAPTQEIRYGQRQVDQILDDRPDMKNVLGAGHPIVMWVVDRFERGDERRRIIWDHTEPASGRSAEHMTYYHGYPAAVRISSAGDTTGLDKWAFLVFELQNIENDLAIQKLIANVSSRNMSPKEFGIRCTELEHEAIVRTIYLLVKLDVRSVLTKKDIGTAKILVTPRDFAEYLQLLDKEPPDAYDPRKYFQEYAERLLNPAAAQNLDSGEAQ